MQILVDVQRAEQSWDFDSGRQQNYLVVEVFGVETRVPCSEEQLLEAIAQATGGPDQEAYDLDIPTYTNKTQQKPVEAQPIFQAPESPIGPPEVATSLEVAPQRKLAPMKRDRGDDAGIPQG